ncbi:MAG: asparagine synthase (glutamine-hydrolyzing) [Candidatus Rokubacteria bacterium]|nr:asparagine synthase (glutamine-hydrolyzing) [Candidatus Rokubacteria bacterium]
MCGIAGKLYFDPARSVDARLLHRMNAALAHRGPDDAGVHAEGQIGLAHRRLSIIDLSAAGHQPMVWGDGRYWITYNGEVYNFLELRAALERDGERFRSRSDTEVILALYARHGAGCLRYLRGMFALAIWDARERTLFLARDRAGKKPLVYYVDDGQLVFGSEPKAVLCDPSVPREPDLVALHHYLSFGYVPAPQCAFRGIRKLPPAHYLLAGPRGIHVERYWRLTYAPKRAASEAEVCAELRERLREAVRLRLVADVPVGAFLSGGVDSSAIVAAMSAEAFGRVKTFSIGFEDARYDELPYARMVAERFGTDHHEFVVKPDAAAALPALVREFDEPFADPAALPTFYLSQMTRQHVKVALNGEGGDENFAGYPRYVASAAPTWFDTLPGPLRAGLAGVVGRLPAAADPWGLYARGRYRVRAACRDRRRRYARWVTTFPTPRNVDLYTRAFRDAVRNSDPLDLLASGADGAEAVDALDVTLAMDVATYLPGDLLAKIDAMSMAHGLEARAPLVDHEMMAFAASLPASLKLRGVTGKYVWKRTVEELLPADVVHRPKQGFAVPIARWLREDLRDMAGDLLLGTRFRERGLVRHDAVARMLDEHVAGTRAWHPQLWSLLALALWFETCLDGAEAKSHGER